MFYDRKGRGRYIRENWKEWFVVRVQEGVTKPPFYMWVNHDPVSYHSFAWIFPLAPFVLVFHICRSIIRVVSRDTAMFLKRNEVLSKKDKIKKAMNREQTINYQK